MEHSPHSFSECVDTCLDVAPVPTDIHLPILEHFIIYHVTYLNADCLQWLMDLVEEHSDEYGGVGETSSHRDGGEGPGSGEHFTSTAVQNTI